jgi:hypothetical protein
MRTTRIAAAVLVAVAAFSLTSCDKFTEPFQDAPRSGVDNNTPMDVVTGSDGFSNLGTKCDHGNRVYVAFHGDSKYAAIAVVPQDPTCRGKK